MPVNRCLFDLTAREVPVVATVAQAFLRAGCAGTGIAPGVLPGEWWQIKQAVASGFSHKRFVHADGNCAELCSRQRQ